MMDDLAAMEIAHLHAHAFRLAARRAESRVARGIAAHPADVLDCIAWAYATIYEQIGKTGDFRTFDWESLAKVNV